MFVDRKERLRSVGGWTDDEKPGRHINTNLFHFSRHAPKSPLSFPEKSNKNPEEATDNYFPLPEKFSFPSCPPVVWLSVSPLWAQRQQLRRRQPSSTQLSGATSSERQHHRNRAAAPFTIKARLLRRLGEDRSFTKRKKKTNCANYKLMVACFSTRNILFC